MILSPFWGDVAKHAAGSAALKGHDLSRAAEIRATDMSLAAEGLRIDAKTFPRGLKPSACFLVLAARLKSCPFKKSRGRVQRHYFSACAAGLLFIASVSALAQTHFNGTKALEYTQQFVAIGPRWPTSPGHLKAEAFLRDQFKHDQIEEDTFTANTPIGPVAMRNFIVRFPGKKDGAIVLGTHYETNYWLRNINFVGANDGGSTTGLLLAIADQLRAEMGHDKTGKLEGYSVWLVFFDGEEAIQSWSASDSTYGSRHLAAKWGRDGTLGRIKAFILADMIGDKSLDIQRETRSSDWLVSLMTQAAKKFGYDRFFFQTESPVDDDHLPFVDRGVPSIDVIDLDYGPSNSYHHTAQDTMDKISARSLTIDGDVFLETIRRIDMR
jgi:glutaminyl-peptide cyclotransferase